MTTQANGSSTRWWFGMADLAGVSLEEAALGLERVHLSIADETFNVLRAVPVTRPVSEPVRLMHHGISRLSYRSVALLGRGVNAAAAIGLQPRC
ncbi:hypothetical protein [Salicola sp. Rm-C-2C1-2]|uniref:hypothetical protein n=1 Tax=Salicola sp. Rm-C-2C1-2 TaxID=3141321 RepID=UPI0032E4207A